MTSNARDVALQVVRDVFPPDGRNERSAQEAFDYRASKAGLSPRDRAFATELAYGSIKMRRTVDWYLAPFVGDRSTPLPPAIAEILRLAIYEFAYTKADEHATVFEFVNLAKKYGHKGVAGLVNAVLRSFLRDRPPAPHRDLFDSDDEYLGTLYSLPTWMVKRVRDVFPENVEAICAAVNDPPQSAIVVNRLKASVDAIALAMEAAGIGVTRSSFAEEALLTDAAAAVRARERDARSEWWIQSESSAMPVAVLNPQPGEAAIDIASGRGNKALQIGARMRGESGFEGTLLCVERDERRSSILGKRLEEGGVPAALVIGDATTELLPPEQRFDRALLDAPCTGLGVIGRHPEARWRKSPDDAERLAITQGALLARLAPHLHEGGVLVYAVCSVDPHETFEVVDAFLRSHDYARAAVPLAFEPFLDARGDVTVPPGIDGRDGFYIARLERRL